MVTMKILIIDAAATTAEIKRKSSNDYITCTCSCRNFIY